MHAEAESVDAPGYGIAGGMMKNVATPLVDRLLFAAIPLPGAVIALLCIFLVPLISQELHLPRVSQLLLYATLMAGAVIFVGLSVHSFRSTKS